MSSNEWQPKRGERVIAVLPDGHEVECEYVRHCLPQFHRVLFDDGGDATLRTVRPLPVTEPTAFGARVVDSEGRRWIRVSRRNGFWWRTWDDDRVRVSTTAWSELPQPVTVIDADPDWGDPR